MAVEVVVVVYGSRGGGSGNGGSVDGRYSPHRVLFLHLRY